MPCTIVLYGATGYSGRLIAVELRKLQKRFVAAYRVVLAGRDEERLDELADALEMESIVFGLDDAVRAQHALGSVGAKVVINAAGPFERTGPVLVAAAIAAGCHYTDINGEADVYLKLKQSSSSAWRSNVALAGSAGFWAAASNLLLLTALEQLKGTPATANRELGAVRIAMSRILTFSRGSAETVWRALRPYVIVVRKDGQSSGNHLVLSREPVGKLERPFDFGLAGHRKSDLRVASAASLVDTLAAQQTLTRRGTSVRSIESYVEAGFPARVAYQVGAWVAPVVAIPAVRAVVQQPAALLAEGPTRDERRDERHIILLEIEDPFRSVLIDWRWETPNVYQFTAHLVAAVAAELGTGKPLKGWVTPAEVLGAIPAGAPDPLGPLRGCRLQRRRG